MGNWLNNIKNKLAKASQIYYTQAPWHDVENPIANAERAAYLETENPKYIYAANKAQARTDAAAALGGAAALTPVVSTVEIPAVATTSPTLAVATSAGPVAVGGTAVEALPAGLVATGATAPIMYALKYKTKEQSDNAYREKANDPEGPSDPNWFKPISEEEQLAMRRASAKAYRNDPIVKARMQVSRKAKQAAAKTQASDALYNSEGSLWKDIPTRKIGGSLKRK